jgi:hypothetical protein
MQSFDIESLLRFAPPQYFCKKCYGLHLHMPTDWEKKQTICKVCGVEYLPTDTYPFFKVDKYLEDQSLRLEFQDIIAHSRTLAGIAHHMRGFAKSPQSYFFKEYPPMRCLLDSLQAAQKFVHFITYGMSLQLLGAISITGLRVPVRGVVSNVSSSLAEEVAKFGEEIPNLTLKLYEKSANPRDWEAAPHQKVIVVDGLLAFKGSANLTVDGWRKAAQGLDFIEVVTDVKEVTDLHNTLFSRVWANFSEVSQITMEQEAPW